MKHPARYSEELMPLLKKILVDNNLQWDSKVLDPFAGTGKIHELPFDTYGIEIEPEWADMHPRNVCGDSTKMSFSTAFFDAICTSPTYGNRMADSHQAKDNSKRTTYTHTLGRKLHKNNSGQMQWGDEYRSLHERVYHECYRVLKPNGTFVLNMKNHIRNGDEIDVTGWHKKVLVGIGFEYLQTESISLKGNGFGANGNVRTGVEYILVFRRN